MSIVQFRKRNTQNKSLRVKSDIDDEPDDTVQINSNKLLKSNPSTKLENENREKYTVTALYDSKRDILPQAYAGDATSTNEIDTSTDRDARAILEKKKDAISLTSNKSTGSFGPVRAPSFLRSTVRFDYQPDICKDYKETGFCGFGDSCKFLHDRGDYKSGWQLDKEWNAAQERKQRLKLEEKEASDKMMRVSDVRMKSENEDEDEDYEVDDNQGFPFACHICREHFKKPIITVCGHYFCTDCAIERNRTTSRCAVCNAQTYGIFNPGRKLIKFIESKEKKMKEKSMTANNVEMPEGNVIHDEPKAVPDVQVKKRKQGTWETIDNE